MQDGVGLLSLTFLGYTSLTLFIGYIALKRTHTLSDYFLGGRRLGPWTTALSAGASDMSGWLLLGLPGYAYSSGFAAIWLIAGLWTGTYFNWKFVSKRLRVFSAELGDAITLPSYFERRFDDQTGKLRLLCAFFIIVFFLFYTSSGLVAGGKLFSSVFGLSYHYAVIVATTLIVVYTLMGGFLAVCWTDLFQALLMLLAVVIVPVMAWIGWQEQSAPFEFLQLNHAELLNPFTNADGTSIGIIGIISLAAWGLGYMGQPHILVRFKAASDPLILNRARFIAVSWSAVAMLGAALAGLLGVGMLPGLGDSETVFMLLVQTLFHPLIAGILVAAILAAIMSTADSQLLVSASTLVEDGYRHFAGKSQDAPELLVMSRAIVAAIALVAMLIALNPEAKVLELVGYAWAGFGAAFGPALLLSLFWPACSRAGAFAGILVGGLTVVIWKPLEGGLFDLYEIVPGFVFSLVAILVFSKLFPADGGSQEELMSRLISSLK